MKLLLLACAKPVVGLFGGAALWYAAPMHMEHHELGVEIDPPRAEMKLERVEEAPLVPKREQAPLQVVPGEPEVKPAPNA